MVRVSTPIASLSNELTGFTDPPAYRTARTIFSPPRSPAKRPTSPVKKFAVRSTKTSAQLERRAVPDGYVRSTQVEQFLANRRTQA